ncbi:hypothetical protein LJR030_004107 [Rhizobium sp. LjRoot30]|uniref:hypothetical protein n=1 Tax=Rhizobium sp. LjRoot30 TaxID=3342320 RepID=UPI003ECED49B
MSDYDELQRLLSSEEFLAGLEDQRMGGSWPFDPYLRCSNDLVQNRVDLVLDDLCVDWLGSYERKLSTSSQQYFIDCANVILANLLRAYSRKLGETVGIPRSKDRLDKQRRYRPKYMTANRFLMAQDWLLETGLMALDKPGYHFSDNAQVSMFKLGARAVTELEADILTAWDFRVVRHDEPVVLKDSLRQLCRYDDTAETTAIRTALDRINARLGATDISTSRELTHLDSDRDFVGSRVNLSRIFNYGSFEYGGRFYGGWWQHIRKHARRWILLDGLPTVEADYRGFNPAVLLAKAGQPIPDDPYARIPGVAESAELRNHAKSTLAALINSATGNTEEPSGFDTVKHSMTKEQFRQSVLDAFPMLPSLLGQRTGMKLQREESDLAEHVMLHFIEQGHAILPIHDAFMVQEHLEGELVQTMKDAFRNKYGQLPQVTVTYPFKADI